MAIGVPKMQAILREYSLKDVFNPAECGYFYKMAADKAGALERISGRNGMKERMNFMPCCDADGSERIELMIIGRAYRSRPFEGKTGLELGFDYHANKKAWMTTHLFFEWLKRFNACTATTEGRKVVLLIDNCRVHCTAETLLALSNLKVRFLPSNTTSKVQPKDAGVMPAMKLRYRRRKIERDFDLDDECVRNVYKVEVLTAMRWFKEIWEEMPISIIFKCWKHINLLAMSGNGRSLTLLLVIATVSNVLNCRGAYAN